MESIKNKWVLIYLMPLVFILSACYNNRWTSKQELRAQTPPPSALSSMFFNNIDSTIVLKAENLGADYAFDAAVKDKDFGRFQDIMRFKTVNIKLLKYMPKDQVLVDIEFVDEMFTTVRVKNVDLLRFIPKYDTQGDMQYGEAILEEYNRFGLNFRKELNEFTFDPGVHSQQMEKIAERVYRLNITNNCLEPTKFEMALLTEDFSDFNQRIKSGKNINQSRLLSHSWFFLQKDLYDYLLKLKNPDLNVDLTLDYDSISIKGEKAVVDFSSLRAPIKKEYTLDILEIGAQSGLKLEPLDREEFYKWQYGIFVNRDSFSNYTDILEKPVKIARFGSRGFYNPETPNVYDYSYLKEINQVKMSVIENDKTEAYVELTFDGPYAPYKAVVGNVDLALLDDQKLAGYLFGYNTYPKSRNYNPNPATIFYDADFYPELQKPYTLLINKNKGTWVNNQKKGFEKVYLSYESHKKEVLLVYFLSYERVTPIWMARLKIPKSLRETVRNKNLLYNY